MRAAMMLLGLVLHAMACYMAAPPGPDWPFRDARTHRAFDALVDVIHMFRMPAFFAVAGFFAALLHDRDGLSGFIRNRARRVLLPLVVFWAIIGPLVLLAFYFAIPRSGLMTRDVLLSEAARTFRLRDLSPMHLWFLWYLVLFYAGAAAVIRLRPAWAVPREIAWALTTSWWSWPLWAAMTTVTLLPMPYAGIAPSPVILADARTLVAYAVFFLFGWLLYRARERLEARTRWWPMGVAVTAACVLAAWRLSLTIHWDQRMSAIVARAAVAAATWVIVLGIFGGFLRYATREHAAIRYLSDASYWAYVVHLPVVVFLAGLLAPLPLHPAAKFAAVLTVTTAACLATYGWLVRNTAIGWFLNGRRYFGAI